MSVPGYAQNAVCPRCDTYTQQAIVSRGQRRCLNCGAEFALKDAERITHGRVIRPERPTAK